MGVLARGGIGSSYAILWKTFTTSSSFSRRSMRPLTSSLFLGGELTHGEWYVLELKRLDFEVMVFEILGDGTVILEVGENIYLAFVKEDFVDVVVA